MEGREPEHETDAAHHAGEHDARVGQLDVEAEDPGHHQEVGDVRIGEDVQQPLRQPHPVGSHPHVALAPDRRELELPLLPADVHLAPVGLRHDVLEVLRHKVDDMDLRRLLRGDRHALADGLHRPLDVAPPPVRNRLAERRGEILDLLSEDSLDLLPLPAHGVRGTDVRAGRHGRNVSRERDEDAGGKEEQSRARVSDGGHRRWLQSWTRPVE